MVYQKRSDSTLPSSRRKFGQRAEQRAQEFLLHQGLTLVEANYQCRCGEIDLIMRDSEVLVFVEVRWHHDLGYGDSAASITWGKQQKIIRTAKFYLQQRRLLNKVVCRFDVVALNTQAELEWIKQAFTAR